VFLRLFQHPEHHVLAELGFLFNRNHQPLLDLCSLTTYFERNWIWSTSNVQANGIMYLIRMPTMSGTGHPGAGPGELLKHHLEGRVELQEHGLKMETDLSPSAYFAYARRTAIVRKERVQRRNCLSAMLEVWSFNAKPKIKWTGDYSLLAGGG
jgi:hypothetical protein